MSDLDEYSRYFPVGNKVGVGIPLPNAEVFTDWAIIHDIDEDLVTLQLSRDVLPVDVSLRYGQILELRGGSEENGYCCRAIVVSEGDARELLLRLIGEIVSDELREFYRIDAFLPIKYFVSTEQNIDLLRKQWVERRARREQLEIEQNDQRWIGKMPTADAKILSDTPHDSIETAADEIVPDRTMASEEVRDSWDTLIPLAANISGGGLRIITHQGFESGEYTLLEILIPSSQRVVDVIGRIVFANRNYAAGSDREYYNTGVQFVYIDERDRDAIVNYISTIQLKRIRQLRERYLFRGMLENDELLDISDKPSIKKTALRALPRLFAVVILALFVYFFWYYAQEHPKGEIQRTFEDSINKYKEQLNKK
ncbi:MAG: PilZ domain-containing protein [Proteobacteria bacterium]|nr:PilZ domain-containing protein [Pseudomonadota bacterium]